MVDLRKRVQVLGKLMPKIRKRMIQLSSNACRNGGMRDETVIHSWANYGWLTVIVTQTFLFYMGLHHHLLSGGKLMDGILSKQRKITMQKSYACCAAPLTPGYIASAHPILSLEMVTRTTGFMLPSSKKEMPSCSIPVLEEG